jgi:hypothetical protein
MNIFARTLGTGTAAALALAVACGGGSSVTPSPSATPTPSPLIHTPGPTESPPATDYRLVYREYGATEDVFWAGLPTDPAQRVELARIAHRDGFGIRAALSPDGTFLVYLSLPDSALSADSSQAEAYILDLKPPENDSEPAGPVKVADGIDYNYTPLWSPDSKLIYMRQYAGPEFLAANVIIIRVRAPDHPTSSRTPTPTPSPAPGIEPVPPEDPVILEANVANVLSFAPVGFADDGKSMYFLQEEGGTEGATLVGIFSPATTKEVDAVRKLFVDSWYAAQAANLQAANDAAAAGLPPPETTVTPVPTPSPDSRFVVQISDQSAFDASLSPDMHKISYVSQLIDDAGDIHNQAYLADIIAATAAPLSVPGISAGDFLRPAWYPDGRLTLSVLPVSGGAGQMVLTKIDGSEVTFLPQPAAGYDTPRSWAPDGTWLALSHSDGSSLANPGEGSLVLVSLTGQRVTVIAGAENAGPDTVLGWVKADTLPTPSPAGG